MFKHRQFLRAAARLGKFENAAVFRRPLSAETQSSLSPKKRHFALLVISEYKLPVSSLRLFSAILQMRRSETNAASVRL